MTRLRFRGRRRWVAVLARLQPWYILTRYPNRLTRSMFAFVNAGISVGVMAAAAIYTQQPLIFPSLGPTAFLCFHKPSAPSNCPRNVILAHGAAILIGWLSSQLVGESTSGMRIWAVALTLGSISALMIATNLSHAPAASTALMIALGAFTGWQNLVALMGAVVLLTAQAYVINSLSGVSYPLWSPRAESDPEGLGMTALETATPRPERTRAAASPYSAVADQLVRRKKTAPSNKAR